MCKKLLTAFIILALTLSIPYTVDGAENNLEQVRCHMYYDGSRPVRLRLAFDFQQYPEKLILKKSQEPYKNSPQGFIEDFIIVKDNGSSLDIVGNVNYKYGNTEDLISVRIIDNIIHTSIDDKYEMRGSSFNYVLTTKVSYVDIDIIRRLKMPEKPEAKVPEIKPVSKSIPIIESVTATLIDSSITDTIYIEKMVRDTIIKIVHDTVFVDKIVYITRDDNNKLTNILCEHLVNWWNDPHYRIDFQFSENPVRLNIKAYNQVLNDAPAGYRAQYKIVPSDTGRVLFIEDIDVEYVHCDNNIMLIRKDDAYFLLARDEIELQPHKFAYDTGKQVSYIRIRY